jgi:hypothetical protein
MKGKARGGTTGGLYKSKQVKKLTDTILKPKYTGSHASQPSKVPKSVRLQSSSQSNNFTTTTTTTTTTSTTRNLVDSTVNYSCVNVESPINDTCNQKKGKFSALCSLFASSFSLIND